MRLHPCWEGSAKPALLLVTSSSRLLTIKNQESKSSRKGDCNFSLKAESHYAKARNCATTLEARLYELTNRQNKKGMRFLTNCVFFDKFGLDVNVVNTYSYTHNKRYIKYYCLQIKSTSYIQDDKTFTRLRNDISN